tara:strand:+ start:376 stop:603 length:228 start_codon:yes stop_codon:yes gene_type:complete
MKEIIKGILEEYANNEANLHSEALREQLTKDIIKALEDDPRDLSVKSKAKIYESPDGKIVFERNFGEYGNRRRIK